MNFDTIFHYQILDKIGAGGMGEVYLAEDTRLRRKVALKLLPAEFTRDDARVRRFEQEARAASALNHPNILTIFEIGEIDGARFIATEFIDGQTLRERLKGGPLAIPAALDLATQVAAALAAAHDAGIVHRDIKPENVMLRRDGIVKVLDFGLAKLAEQRHGAVDSEAPTLAKINTDPGTVMGTASYMSPEQARGQEVDARSDIFSLGVLFYEMLAGGPPFMGVNPLEVISEILKTEPAPLSAHASNPLEAPPVELQRIVSKALRKNRDERYPTGKELLADLKELKRDLDFHSEERRRSSGLGSVGGAGRIAPISGQGLAQVEMDSLQPASGEQNEDSATVDIAHVLFCDIVGYSILPIDLQKQMISALQEIVRQTEGYRRADSRGQLVRLPAGDGMALAFLQDPVAPVRCAFEISRALQTRPEIGLRMGIHSGPVFLSTDINGTRNVVGSGINMAQRVMDSGDAGHILVSRNVAEVLAQVSNWQPLLHDLGEREVKHGVRIHLYNVHTDELGNAARPTKLQTDPVVPKESGGGASSAPVGEDAIRAGSGSGLTPAETSDVETPSRYQSPSRTDGTPSIAILPFANLSADTENEYFCDGLAEELLNALAKIEGLKVAARASAFSFKGKNASISEIGSALKVKTALEGSVRKSGARLRITVQLINTADGYHLWSERYDRELQDIFEVQDEITLAVVESLKVKLFGAERAVVFKRYTENTDAYQFYLKGRYHFSKWTEEGLKRSVEYFEQAIDSEPGYAPAFAGLVNSYVAQWFYGYLPPEESVFKAKELAPKALALDNTLAESHLAIARLKFFHEWDFDEAEREFKQALKLNPNYAYAHEQYSLLLAVTSRADEALAEAARALELDPLSLALNLNIGIVCWCVGQGDRLREQGRKLIEIEPRFYGGYWITGIELWADGRYEQSISQHQHAATLGASLRVLSNLGCLYGIVGERDKAEQLLDQLQASSAQRYLDPFSLALIYAGLGEKDRAFSLLEQAYEQREGMLVFLGNIGRLIPGFSADPRFDHLLRRIGLPGEQSG